MTRDALVDDLRKALAADRVRDGAVELGLYRGDASNMIGGARVVCFPTRWNPTAEAQAVFAEDCVAAGLRLKPS